MDSDSKPKLKSLISQLVSASLVHDWQKMLRLITRIISLVSSMDLDSQPKSESEFMSLIKQTISLLNSLDLDSQPKPLSQLISLISKKFSRANPMDPDRDSEMKFMSLISSTLSLKPEPELLSLIYPICCLAFSVDLKLEKYISSCPQVYLYEGDPKFRECRYYKWYFVTRHGKHYEEYEKAPVEIKHHLHPKHSLQLVFFNSGTMKCYCCQEDLEGIIYCCQACDFAIHLACVEKPPVFSIKHWKWHEHTLVFFPTQAPLTCNVCALTHSTCPFYICPPCDFVVHQSCMALPSVIRISRHLHRLSFAPYFDQGDCFCGVCRRKINNDYGGYSCTKDGYSYVAHSKCATQPNMWDGKELEGEPEEIEEEEVEPFLRISDGIIQHFCHQHHHLRLEENTCRDYDDNKQCQACITPIYFGNFYSCMQCDFILHEVCANFPRKINSLIHPHMLTLVGGYDGVMDFVKDRCSACHWMCGADFFYQCGKEECHFRLHLQCATISEPLVNESHMHPLFLTSKPEERRMCSLCRMSDHSKTNETFNCIESECDFCLCFGCATIPQKVRYKHDTHMLTLSYKKVGRHNHPFLSETSLSWCEVCEKRVSANNWFYKCDENYCVTLHISCLLGMDRYMKPGSSWLHDNRKVNVLPNNHHMSRPICSTCKKRCPQKIVFQMYGLILCSSLCVRCTHPREEVTT